MLDQDDNVLQLCNVHHLASDTIDNLSQNVYDLEKFLLQICLCEPSCLSATVFVPKRKPTQICTWSNLLRILGSSFKQILQECSKCLQMIYWESIENLLESIKIYWESVETNINAIITITQNALYSYRWLWVSCPCTACSLHILFHCLLASLPLLFDLFPFLWPSKARLHYFDEYLG